MLVKGIANELSKIVQPKLTIANRTMSRFETWDMDINAISLEQSEQYLDEFDIIINTTSAGLNNNDDIVISLDNNYHQVHSLVILFIFHIRLNFKRSRIQRQYGL